ncbi:MAG: hypothetical protein ACRDFR_00685, partial [Candidatus Limnocylindria bacterium]
LDLLVLDLDGPAPTRFDRLAALLSRSDATALLLARAEVREAAGRMAGVRVRLERQAWLAVGRDLIGMRVTARVTRHRWALAGSHTELDLYFGEGRRIDPLLPVLAVPQPPAIDQPEELPALTVLSA